MSSKINNIYIHFPFCNSKCDYCGFYSRVYNNDDFREKYDKYLNSLQEELYFYNDKYDLSAINTIFVGGGSPSLNGTYISDLSKILNETLDFKIHFFQKQDYDKFEWTVECNPTQINPLFIESSLQNGVNRFSIGIQSFSNKALLQFGRHQTVEDVFQALDLFAEYNKIGYDFCVSVDLINNLLLSSNDVDFEMNYLQEILRKYRFVNHLSVYDISFDEGSSIYKDKKLYRQMIQNEDINYQYLSKLQKLLSEECFIRYEVSNFARHGFQCRHNLGYWLYKNYIGLGPAAYGTVDCVRIENRRDLDAYNEDFNNIRVETVLTLQERIEEYLLMNLRLINHPIETKAFTVKYGISLEDMLQQSLKKYVACDYINISTDTENNKLAITHLGINYLNTILIEMFEEMDCYFEKKLFKK